MAKVQLRCRMTFQRENNGNGQFFTIVSVHEIVSFINLGQFNWGCLIFLCLSLVISKETAFWKRTFGCVQEMC